MTQGDTASYLIPGHNLLTHGAFIGINGPELDRTPGYPIFAMLASLGTGNPIAIAIAQIAISLLSILLISRTASLAFPKANPTSAIAAAWLFAFEPISILYSVRLLPETLFTFLMLLVLERLVTFFKSRELRDLFFAGIALAAATYVRPISYYLAPLIALGLAAAMFRDKTFRWQAPATLLLTTVPLLAIWQIRNTLDTGYSGFSSIVEKNLYFYQAAGVQANLRHISLIDEQTQLGYFDEATYNAIHPNQKSWIQPQRLQYLRSSALSVLRTHPILTAKIQFTGSGIVAFTPCAQELLQLVDLPPPSRSMPQRILSAGIVESTLVVLKHQPVVAVHHGHL